MHCARENAKCSQARQGHGSTDWAMKGLRPRNAAGAPRSTDRGCKKIFRKQRNAIFSIRR
jgi:hypothetical protein